MYNISWVCLLPCLGLRKEKGWVHIKILRVHLVEILVGIRAQGCLALVDLQLKVLLGGEKGIFSFSVDNTMWYSEDF